MADKRISELEAITGANTAADDFFLVVDTSGAVTKKISRAELNNAIEQDVLSVVDINGGTIDGTVIGGTTPAAISGTTGTFSGNLTVDTNTLFVDAATNNVGIGTSSPDSGTPLHVQESSASLGANPTASALLVERAGSVAMTLGTSNTGSASIFFGDPENLTGGRVQYDNSNNALQFWANNIEHMRLTSDGRLGLGVSAPQQKIHIGGTSPSIAVDKNGSGSDNIIYYDNATTSNALYIGRDSSNVIFRTSSTEKMRLTSDGRIGLGVSSPDGNLNVHRTAASAGWIINGQTAGIANDSGLYMDASNNIELSVRNGSGTLTAAVRSSGSTFFNGGNVGIGTAVPTGKLTIRDGVPRIDLLEADGSAGFDTTTILREADVLYIQTRNNGSFVAHDYMLTTSASGASSHQWRIANSERLRLTSDGRLGLGVSAPGAKLNVVDNTSADAVRITQTGTGNALVVEDSANPDSTPFVIDSSGIVIVGHTEKIQHSTTFPQIETHTTGSPTNSITSWASSSADPARFILAKSRSGTIGTRGVVTSGTYLGLIRFMGDDGTSFIDAAAIGAYADGTPGTNDMPGRLVFSTTADGASSPTERLRITSAGSLLVGTSSPFTSAARIHVDVASATLGAWVSSTATTSGRLHMRFENPNGVVGSISTSGTATSYNVSSDYRLKENVTAITDGIERVKQLNPSRFNFISDADTAVDGFLAHEAAAVVPEAVTGEKDAVDADGNPEYQGIDQSKLVPLLTAALQEAISKIESLEARIVALETA